MANTVNIGDYQYTLNDDTGKAAAVVRDKTKSSYENIPSTITVSGHKYTVTSLRDCFLGCTKLTSAPAIPSSVTIMIGCFSGCRALTTAPTIPSSVTNLSRCFQDCMALTTAPTIPSSVTNLSRCFQNCRVLTTAPTIPSSVTSLSYCFYNCMALTTAPTIPSSVIYLDGCFFNCNALTSAPTIPSSVTLLSDCFLGCSALTGNIIINANATEFDSLFVNTQKGIWLTGSSSKLSDYAATGNNNNVYVGEIPLSYSLTIERVVGDGGTVQDPEGLFAHIQLTINWAVFAENSIEAITLKNGMASTNPTWYTDAAKTSTITLPNWRPSASTTIHCWLAITSATHVFSVTVADRYHTGVVISFTVPQQFRTMDFLAGGQGVAFGMPATQNGMFINMDLAIKEYSNIVKNIYDVFYPVGSYYETNLPSAIPSGQSTPTSTDLENLGVTWFDPNYAWGGTWVRTNKGDKVLFSGDTTGDITLAETVANFEYITIFFRDNDGIYDSTNLFGNNLAIALSQSHTDYGTTQVYIKTKTFSVVNNTIKQQKNGNNVIRNAQIYVKGGTFYKGDYIYIVKVIGRNRINGGWHRTA